MAGSIDKKTITIPTDGKPKNGALIIVLEYLNGSIESVYAAERNGGSWSTPNAAVSVTETNSDVSVSLDTLDTRDLYATLIRFPDKQIIDGPEK